MSGKLLQNLTLLANAEALKNPSSDCVLAQSVEEIKRLRRLEDAVINSTRERNAYERESDFIIERTTSMKYLLHNALPYSKRP